jgi:HSP20 family protein
MNTLTGKFRQGAQHAWASLSEGWHDLRLRASDALTHFQHDDASSDGRPAPTLDRFGSVNWGLMAADIRFGDERVVVRLEAPGMDRNDLHIDISGNRLSVWGEKRFDSETRLNKHPLVQCAYGSFRRDLVLPQPVDAERAIASYRDGVLRIEMPVLAHRQGRRIAVHAGE